MLSAIRKTLLIGGPYDSESFPVSDLVDPDHPTWGKFNVLGGVFRVTIRDVAAEYIADTRITEDGTLILRHLEACRA